ncbi:MAG TPA: gamma-glutamyl-phosphate reductase, partial [Firmicutes bacterium]|nr:gamma-glutamyl-phosphate reductase [Bacillota bacterium]
MQKIQQQVVSAKAASRLLALTSAAKRSVVLNHAAELVRAHAAEIICANDQDLQESEKKGLDLLRKRILTISAQDVEAMAAFLERMGSHDDAVNRVCESYSEPNGLRREQRLVPLGVIAMVYEARPSVVCDSVGLCLRTANALLLRCSPF